MRILTLLVILVLTACGPAKPTIHAKSNNDISYEQVVQNVEIYQGQIVRWGGMIGQVANYENFSELTIVQFPLTRHGVPISTEPSAGRFIVRSEHFLDPLIYSPDKLVTIIGTVMTLQLQKVDQKMLALPLIAVDDSHVWPQNNPASSRTYNPKHDAPFLGYGYYGTGTYAP
jgi:outer membrane lipoprotein